MRQLIGELTLIAFLLTVIGVCWCCTACCGSDTNCDGQVDLTDVQNVLQDFGNR